MTDEISVQSTGTKKPRSRKRLVAMLATGALILAGGITVVSATASRASAEETVRICTAALDKGASATRDAVASTAAADKALGAVKSTTLPKDAGTSTKYAQRPAIKAAKTVPARASGADVISDVTQSRTALVETKIPTQCTDRDQADAIGSVIEQHSTAAKVLDTSVTALQVDFTVFQADETKHIAAEKAAAAKKQAEAEAAAKQKAEDEAAAEAAAAAAQEAPQYVAQQPADTGGYVPAPAPYVPAPAPYVPAPAPYVPAPAPAPAGGGGFVGGGRVGPVPDGSFKACWDVDENGAQVSCL